MHRLQNTVALASRTHWFGCHRKWASATFRLQSLAASSHSEITQDVKPFDDIPGPGGLPYFGTYFKYQLGKLSSADGLHFISSVIVTLPSKMSHIDIFHEISIFTHL